MLGGKKMSRKDKGGFAQKHPPDHPSDPRIAEAVKTAAREGKISCAAAFELARSLGVSPKEVGVEMDLQEIPVTHCQLGLFGYGSKGKGIEAAGEVPPALAEAIHKALVNGRLPCASAWEMAEAMGLSKREVASACEALKIKISACQLGTF
jgi:hypothetical protein